LIEQWAATSLTVAQQGFGNWGAHDLHAASAGQAAGEEAFALLSAAR
jgi:hypothetical protein